MLHKPHKTLNELYEDDSTIFNLMTLPESVTVSDFKNTALLEVGSLETLFDYARDIQAYLGIWSRIRAPYWIRIADALADEYNPLHNYDMSESGTDEVLFGRRLTRTNDLTHTRTDNLTETRTDALQRQRTDNLSHTKTGTEGDSMSATGTATPGVTETVAQSRHGFDSANAVPVEETVTSRTGSDGTSQSGSSTRTYNTTDADTGTQTEADTGTQTHVNTGTQTEADTGTQTDSNSGKDTTTHELDRSGNIGVTSSQQLLEAEIALRSNHDLVTIILNDMKRAIMVCVY